MTEIEIQNEIKQLKNTRKFKRRTEEIDRKIEYLFTLLEKNNEKNNENIELIRPEIKVNEEKDDSVDLILEEISDIIKPEPEKKSKKRNKKDISLDI